MNKYTPGPWIVQSDGKVGPRSKEDDQSYGMIMPVAYIEQYDHPDSYTVNARLIAAAPELFELLQAIIDSGEIPYCSSHPLVIAAEQLISKVTGE